MARETASKSALLPGCQATLADVRSKERYNEKLKIFLWREEPLWNIQRRMEKRCWPLARCYLHKRWYGLGFFAKSVHWRGSDEWQKPWVLPALYSRLGEGYSSGSWRGQDTCDCQGNLTSYCSTRVTRWISRVGSIKKWPPDWIYYVINSVNYVGIYYMLLHVR